MSLADELEKLDRLRQSGALTDAEFADAKAALLAAGQSGSDQLGEHLAEVRYHNELARIDREWEIEREQYLIRSRYGTTHVPTTAMGLGVAVLGGLFGAFWTIMALSMTRGGPDEGPFSIARIFFPIFGVVFTLVMVGFGMSAYSKAKKYEAAHAAYQARRRQVKL